MKFPHRPKTKLTSSQIGLFKGFRSGLEVAIASELDSQRVEYHFEKTKLSYTKPEKVHTYTPDFYLVQKIYTLKLKDILLLKTDKNASNKRTTPKVRH